MSEASRGRTASPARDASPASSPPPPPPTLSTPGPRAAALQKLYNDAVAHVLKTCSYGNFAACFPTPARHAAADLRDVHGQFVAKLDHWLHREFESILLARDVVPSLNELDRLVEDARRRKAAAAAESDNARNNGDGVHGAKASVLPPPPPPHTLPPTQLYLSHLAPTLGMYEAQMKARHDALASENQMLLEKVLRQRKDIEGLVGGLERVVHDLSGSVEALKPEEMERLRDEVRSADEMLR